MQTGQDVQILGDPLLTIVFIWVTMLFLGLQKDRSRSPGPPLRLSIALLPMLLLKQFDFVSYSLSSIALLSAPQLSTVTIFPPSTWPLIQFNIDVLNTLRLIFTLFVRRWHSTKFVFCMFLQVHSLLIYSQRGSLPHHSLTFAPVSTSLNQTLTLRGGGDIRDI
jgi:hypothetical protein